MGSFERIDPPIVGWIISVLHSVVGVAAALTLALFVMRWILGKTIKRPLVPKMAIAVCLAVAVMGFALVVGIQSIRALVSLL